MSINFNRNNAQVVYENIIGVENPEELVAKKEDFKNHALSYADVEKLSNALRKDAVNYFYNGVLSFSEGIDAVFQKRFSWATVELYYSIFYLTRATLATKGVALLRNNTMYRLKVRVNEKPYTTGNKKYKATHEGTLAHYIDLYGQSDKLLSNNIEDMNVYEWMKNLREIVNYRCAVFAEPDCLSVWDYFNEAVDIGKLPLLLEKLENDSYVMCFQEEYAVVAIPIKRMQQTINDMYDSGIDYRLLDERKTFVKDVLGYGNRELNFLNQIFV